MSNELKLLTLEEIKKFITFLNPNNFDEYFSKTLSDQGSI
jgi:hypothetical protein